MEGTNEVRRKRFQTQKHYNTENSISHFKLRYDLGTLNIMTVANEHTKARGRSQIRSSKALEIKDITKVDNLEIYIYAEGKGATDDTTLVFYYFVFRYIHHT